jgi:nucleoid DNA-binding protein
MADKRISKTQLAAELADATGTNKKTANQFLESLCEIAYREGGKSGEFTIPGLGKLVTRRHESGEGKDLAPTHGDLNSNDILIYPNSRAGRKRATRTVKDTPLRGKIGRSRIRAAVREVSHRHNGS